MQRIIVLAALLVACKGGGADPGGRTVSGTLTDGGGAQARFAGSGTVSVATSVEVHTIGSSGATTLHATADVGADGSYTASLPADTTVWVVVQAVDAEGAVLGSVVVEPTELETVGATPLSTETSAEAEVFLDMGATAELWAHTRARIDADTAAAVSASNDVDTALLDLSDAVEASTRAEIAAWGEAGHDADAIAQQQIAIAGYLSASLAAGETTAYEDFLLDLDVAAEDEGVTPEERADANASASLAFRATLDAHGATDLLDASARASAEAEARAWEAASHAYLEAAGATQAELDALGTLNADLMVELEASGSASAVAAATSDWKAGLIGSGSVDGSLLGTTIGADVIVEAALDSAVQAAASASASVEASIEASASAAVLAGFDAEVFAQATVMAMNAHRTAVRATLDGLLVAAPEAATSAELIIAADASFRGL